MTFSRLHNVLFEWKLELFWGNLAVRVPNSPCSLWTRRFLNPGLSAGFCGEPPQRCEILRKCEITHATTGGCSQKLFCCNSSNKWKSVFIFMLYALFQHACRKASKPYVWGRSCVHQLGQNFDHADIAAEGCQKNINTYFFTPLLFCVPVHTTHASSYNTLTQHIRLLGSKYNHLKVTVK